MSKSSPQCNSSAKLPLVESKNIERGRINPIIHFDVEIIVGFAVKIITTSDFYAANFLRNVHC